MTTIVAQTPEKVNTIDFLLVLTDQSDVTQLTDDIYPFDGGEDRWVVVMNGQMVNWARDWGKACSLYVEALRVNREHIQHTIPFDGSDPLDFDDEELIFASSADLWPDADDYGLGAAI